MPAIAVPTRMCSFSMSCVIDWAEHKAYACPRDNSGTGPASAASAHEDMQCWRAGDVEGEESNSGATATVALVRRDKIVVANVGDSRAVVSRRHVSAGAQSQVQFYQVSAQDHCCQCLRLARGCQLQVCSCRDVVHCLGGCQLCETGVLHMQGAICAASMQHLLCGVSALRYCKAFWSGVLWTLTGSPPTSLTSTKCSFLLPTPWFLDAQGPGD